MTSYPDHPRSCGANFWESISTIEMFGSSPLVRGQLPPHSLPGGRSRIIPARAGPTRPRRDSHNHRKDHPRSCGANRISRHAISCYSGSSPLVRGQRIWPLCFAAASRIIPARAGPTVACTLTLPVCPDHPRSCGANWNRPEEAGNDFGSSPLVRGQHPIQPRRIANQRIIPARAGPTRTLRQTHRPHTDHPRSCGANACCRACSSAAFGSSPLVRGQPQSGRTGPLPRRIIPARAGPTLAGRHEARPGPDHPRSCGANGTVSGVNQRQHGSSPLVRGQRWCR